MPVEITILSGQRQGERIELAENAFEVGDQPTDAVHFDAATDPEVKGRRASVRLEDGGWRIRSTGALPIIVNHDPVERPHALRSGDIVRMSENGPDFSFALINRLSVSPNATPVATEPTKATTASTRAAAPPESDLKTESVPLPIKLSTTAVAAVVAVVCVSLFAVVFLRPGGSDVTEPPSPTLAHVPALSVDEGKELLWLPEVLNAEGVEGFSFALSADRPKGMEIDRETGAIRWTPTEEQAPGEYTCQLTLSWSSDSQKLSSTANIFCKAKEVNQAPTLEPIPLQTLDLLQGDSLDLVVTATDSDHPAQSVTFQLGRDAPRGMQIDASSGRITWSPNESFANKTVTVPVEVTDDGKPPLTTTGELRVSVLSPDPWEIAADQVRQNLYLVGVQPTDSQTILPLGTACAIDAETLLTSATVATGLEEGRQRGWEVVAIKSTQLHDLQAGRLQITDLQVHVGWTKSEEAETRIFFDLGLLKVDGRLETSCQLATAESLADLAVEPQSLGCVGFELDGGPLTRFDLPTADLKRVELYSVIALPGADGATVDAPPLLQLSGELPANPFGSPIITGDGKVVGVYAIQAELPEDAELQHIHYAPVVTLVSAWLAGEGRSHWVQPQPAQTTTPSGESNERDD